MITNLIFLLGAGLLYMLASMFSAFSIEVPVYIAEAISYLFTAIQYVNGEFPLLDALLAGLFLLGIYWRTYIIKIFLWMFSLIPIIGKGSGLPQHQNSTDLRPDAPAGTVDLRSGKNIGRKFRTMQDIKRR